MATAVTRSRMVVGGKPAAVVTTVTTSPAGIQPGGRGSRVGAALAALPQWALILGGLGVLIVVWYVTRPKKGGRAWKSRRPFA